MGKGKRKRGQAAPHGTSEVPSSPPIVRVESALRGILALLLLAVILALYPYTRDASGPIKYLVIAWGIAIAAVAFFILGTLQNAPWRTPRVFFVILAAFTGVNLLAALASDHVAYA
ncbi:MAG: hypothetical protein R6V12_14915, partial [Candidatus Hydrogenedentota bacterium]